MKDLKLNEDNNQIYRWFSFRAKNLLLYAEKSFVYFQYPLATNFAQESMEFAGKAILEMHNIGYDHNVHDFSKSFSQLNRKYPEYKKEISDCIEMSDRWLKKSREISRYGVSGLSPEQRFVGRRTIANNAIKDTKKILDFLIKVERRKKSNITIGILNGKIFGNRADKHPLTKQARNRVNKSIWKRRLLSQLKTTRFNVNIKEISVSKIDSSMDIVINPFGEYFPVDNSDLEILNLIKNFISTGGTFMNLGGLPFWGSQNVETGKGKSYIIPELKIRNRRLVTTLLFKNSLSWQMFDIKTTGDTNYRSGPNLSNFYQKEDDKQNFGNLERNIQIHEYRGLLPKTPNVIPIIRMNRDDFGEIYPIGLKQIGFGYLFLVSLEIHDDEEVNLAIDALKGYLNWLYPDT